MKMQREFDIENIFTKSESKFDVEPISFDEDYSEEQKQAYEKLMSGIIGMNKDCQKLSEVYKDVVKMASTYFDNVEEQSTSTLEAKLSRYYT